METIATLYSVSSLHFLGNHHPVQTAIVSFSSTCDSRSESCVFFGSPRTKLSGWRVLLEILETTTALRSVSAGKFLGDGHSVHRTPLCHLYNLFQEDVFIGSPGTMFGAWCILLQVVVTLATLYPRCTGKFFGDRHPISESISAGLLEFAHKQP